MDFKQEIDKLTWVRSPEEIEMRRALKDAVIQGDRERYKGLWKKSTAVMTDPPLRQVGLEKPVFYAFQARAEWEMLVLAEMMGRQLKEEYRLYPAGQRGIGLDWYKLNERIWVPADYLEARSIAKDTRAIFSHDEGNCMSSFGAIPEDVELSRKVIYGPDKEGSSEAKIEALSTNHEWRTVARTYSVRLLKNAGRQYVKYVKEEFRPVLDALISAYRSEMI